MSHNSGGWGPKIKILACFDSTPVWEKAVPPILTLVPGKLAPPWMSQGSLFRMLGLISGVLESLPGNPEVRCAFCAGDSGSTVGAGVQRDEARARGPIRREDGLIWQGSGTGREGRVWKTFRIPILLPKPMGAAWQ